MAMSPTMMDGTLRGRIANAARSVPTNIGMDGGDLMARRLALVLMVTLTAMTIPLSGVSYSTLKIVALLASMSGTLFLMAGLVFVQKTHFAGVMLIPTAYVMLLLSSLGNGYRWGAVALGTMVIFQMVQNIVTRRCGINKLLGVNSCRERAAREALRKQALAGNNR